MHNGGKQVVGKVKMRNEPFKTTGYADNLPESFYFFEM